MPYTYVLTTTLPASAQEIYEAWLDSLAHSEMTRGGASMSDEVGAEVSAWDGYITGRNLELVPHERIVQSWRTTQFTDEHEDSIVTVTLEELEDGTLLMIEHSNVPDEQKHYEEGGWQEHYFDPMKEYFTGRKQADAGAVSKASAPKTKIKRKRVAARAKSRRAAPKAKIAAGRKPSRRTAASKAKPGRAKTAAKKKSAQKRKKSRPARSKQSR
jgi:uncharacterized protein YndB with AHSA1/START domain